MSPGTYGLIAAVVLFPGLADVGAETDSETAEHSHAPIVVSARPIVSRISAPVDLPRRLLLDDRQNLFVADWGTGSVLKLDANGDLSIVIDRLNEPAGLAQDSRGVLYVSTYAQGMTGAGAIVRVSETGEPETYVDELSGPTAIAFDANDNLFIACFDRNHIMRVTPNRERAIFVTEISNPTALLFDSAGRLLVASSGENSVLSVTPMGEVSTVARGFLDPSDLAFDPDGRLVVVNLGGTELTYVDAAGKLHPFALVPKGTMSVAFTLDHNFIVANRDFHLLLKVTSQLSVPCPHCEKPIPLQFKAESPEKPRSPMF